MVRWLNAWQNEEVVPPIVAGWGHSLRPRGLRCDTGQGFSASSLWTLGPNNSLLWGCPVHSRTFSSISGFKLLDVQFGGMCHSEMCPDIAKLTLVENHGVRVRAEEREGSCRQEGVTGK